MGNPFVYFLLLIKTLLKNLRPFQNYNFKIQWEIHFFTFLIIDQNALKKKFSFVIRYTFQSNLLLELILDLGKCPYQKTHESESAGFLLRALLEHQGRILDTNLAGLKYKGLYIQPKTSQGGGLKSKQGNSDLVSRNPS